MVLPMPPAPDSAEIISAEAFPDRSAPTIASISISLPVKSAASAGSCRGTCLTAGFTTWFEPRAGSAVMIL